MEQQKFAFPIGFKFHPTNEELVIHYLVKKVVGKLPSFVVAGTIHDSDLYGSKEPWEIWESYGGKKLDLRMEKLLEGEKFRDGLYFFTRLKMTQNAASRIQIDRAVGAGGTWHLQNNKAIFHPKSNRKIAYKKRFLYQNSNPNPNSSQFQNNGAWVMNEFRLVQPLTDIVVCKLKRKARKKKRKLEDVEWETETGKRFKYKQVDPSPAFVRFST